MAIVRDLCRLSAMAASSAASGGAARSGQVFAASGEEVASFISRLKVAGDSTTAPEEMVAAFFSCIKGLALSSTKGLAPSSTKGLAPSSIQGLAPSSSKGTPGLEVALACKAPRGAGAGIMLHTNRGALSRCVTRNTSQYTSSRGLFVPPNCCGANVSKMTPEEKLAADRMLLDNFLQVMVDSWTNMGNVQKRLPFSGPFADVLNEGFTKLLGIIINAGALFCANILLGMAYLATRKLDGDTQGTGQNVSPPPASGIAGLLAAILKVPPPSPPASPPVAPPAPSTVVIVLGKPSPGFVIGQELPGLYVPPATPQEQGDNPNS